MVKNIHKTEEYQEWTEVIRPSRGIFDIKLGELWRYRDLIMLFVKRDFVSVYKQTILGPLWLFIQPLFTTLMFLVVFTKVAKISTDNVHPVLFYLSGITLWNYFSDCFNKTSNTFVSNAYIFGKVYFPRLVSPISVVISSLIKLGIQLILFIVIWAYLTARGEAVFEIHSSILIFPYLVLLMAVLGLGLGIIFSSLTTKYRDLIFLLQFGIQLLMYATPIIYPLSYTTGKLRSIIALNPLTPIIETMRYVLFNIGSLDLPGLIYATAFSIVVLVFGIIVFNQVEKSFMDTV